MVEALEKGVATALSQNVDKYTLVSIGGGHTETVSAKPACMFDQCMGDAIAAFWGLVRHYTGCPLPNCPR